MRHARLDLLVVAAIAASLVGCGGSSTQSANSGHANTHSSATPSASSNAAVKSSLTTTGGSGGGRGDLIARADAICRRLNEQTASVQTTTLESVGRAAPLLAGYYRTALSQLRELTPPAAMSRDWNRIVSDYDVILREVVKMGKFATDNDPASTVRVETGIGHIQLRRIAIAKHNGFTDCATV